jgi:hypothetical protein
MARTQHHPTGNEVKANVVQANLEELFELAHDHVVKRVLPGANDGAIGDIVLYDDNTTVYILIKTSRGWFRTSALTAL